MAMVITIHLRDQRGEDYWRNSYPPREHHNDQQYPEWYRIPSHMKMNTPVSYGSIPIRKTVPVNQWKISFSGEERTEKSDLNIHDFLEQVEMFSRAQNID